jgi:hypothetical protein
MPFVSSDKLHLIVFGRVASHMLRHILFWSVPNQTCCAGYLGYYWKLEEIDSVHIPIPINLIFVGFNGEGNQGIATFIHYLMMTCKIEAVCTRRIEILGFHTTGRKVGNLIDSVNHVRFRSSCYPQEGHL